MSGVDLNQLRQLHKPVEQFGMTICDDEGKVWPCTVAALLDALDTARAERAEALNLAADAIGALDQAIRAALVSAERENTE